MPRAGFKFGTTQNSCPHSLWCVIVILVLIFVLFDIIILNSLLTYIFMRLFALTFYNCQVFISNHRPRILLFDISVLSFFPYLKLYNFIYYINTTMRSFQLVTKSFLKLFSCSLESPTSDRSFFTDNAFWANLKGFVSVSRTS